MPPVREVFAGVVDDVVGPSDRTSSVLAMLHTPVTSVPNALAICTAKEPTPPDAPMISTFCPGCTLALRMAFSAVPPEIG